MNKKNNQLKRVNLINFDTSSENKYKKEIQKNQNQKNKFFELIKKSKESNIILYLFIIFQSLTIIFGIFYLIINSSDLLLFFFGILTIIFGIIEIFILISNIDFKLIFKIIKIEIQYIFEFLKFYLKNKEKEENE